MALSEILCRIYIFYGWGKNLQKIIAWEGNLKINVDSIFLISYSTRLKYTCRNIFIFIDNFMNVFVFQNSIKYLNFTQDDLVSVKSHKISFASMPRLHELKSDLYFSPKFILTRWIRGSAGKKSSSVLPGIDQTNQVCSNDDQWRVYPNYKFCESQGRDSYASGVPI